MADKKPTITIVGFLPKREVERACPQCGVWHRPLSTQFRDKSFCTPRCERAWRDDNEIEREREVI